MALKRMSYPVQVKAVGDENVGRVEAIVAVFNNVDLVGDRILPGAFKNSIAEWKASGDPVPVVFSHEWGDLFSHIGLVEEMEETSKGLRVVYLLDIADNPAAAQAFKLLKRRTLKEHSFAYDVITEKTASDGANNLIELRLIEIGPTLKGANPETELVAVKDLIEASTAESKDTEMTDTATLDAPEPDEADGAKAGRRISKTTEVELNAIHEEIGTIGTSLAAAQARLKALTGTATEDDGKSVEGAPTTDVENPTEDDREPEAKSIDGQVLDFKTRIESLRA